MRWTMPFVALLALAGVPAQADSPPQPPRQPVDANADGVVTREEAQKSMPRMSAHFDKIDANGDGKVERAEMHEFRMQRKGGWPNADDAT